MRKAAHCTNTKFEELIALAAPKGVAAAWVSPVLRENKVQVICGLTAKDKDLRTISFALKQDVLLEALKDPEYPVRGAAIHKLAELLGSQALPHLADFLKFPPGAHFQTAVDAISKLRSKAAQELIIRTAENYCVAFNRPKTPDEWQCGFSLVNALGKLGKECHYGLMYKLIGSHRPGFDAQRALSRAMILTQETLQGLGLLIDIAHGKDGVGRGMASVLRNDRLANKKFYRALDTGLSSLPPTQQEKLVDLILTSYLAVPARILESLAMSPIEIVHQKAMNILITNDGPIPRDTAIQVIRKTSMPHVAALLLLHLKEDESARAKIQAYRDELSTRVKNGGDSAETASIILSWLERKPSSQSATGNSSSGEAADSGNIPLRILDASMRNRTVDNSCVNAIAAKLNGTGSLDAWAIEALGKSRSPLAYAHLLARLWDEHDQSRRRSLESALLDLGSAQLFPALFQGLEHCESCSQRKVFNSILSRLSLKQQRDLEIDSPRNDDSAVRTTCRFIQQVLDHIGICQWEEQPPFSSLRDQLNNIEQQTADDFIKQDIQRLTRKLFPL